MELIDDFNSKASDPTETVRVGLTGRGSDGAGVDGEGVGVDDVCHETPVL